MKKVFEKFDDDSKEIIYDLIKDDKKIGSLIQRLQQAKEKVKKQAQISKIINQKIER